MILLQILTDDQQTGIIIVLSAMVVMFALLFVWAWITRRRR